MTIYSADELGASVYEGQRFIVCGIGRGRRRTLFLLEQMITDMYKDEKSIDVAHYFTF